MPVGMSLPCEHSTQSPTGLLIQQKLEEPGRIHVYTIGSPTDQLLFNNGDIRHGHLIASDGVLRFLSVLVKEHQPTFAFREEGVVVVHSIDITDGSKAVFQSNDVLNGVASTVVVGLTPQR